MTRRMRGASFAAASRTQLPNIQAYDNPATTQVTVGAATDVWGPIYQVDSPFLTFNVSGTIRGYTGNTNTAEFRGTSITNLSLVSQNVLAPGTGFDSCGAWLTAAYQDGGTIRGWYHAETACNYTVNQTHKSVAYCESADGGDTWTKPNYPNNQVMTGVTTPTTGVTTGLGDQTVVKRPDGYYYAYFNPADPNNWGVGVARATVASGGLPGTWRTYYNGSWTGDGFADNVTILSNITGTAVHNLSQTDICAVSNNLQSLAGTDGGIYLSFSKDGINWRKHPTALYAFGSNNVGYASCAGVGAADYLGASFYLFYMEIRDGDWGHRYLVRRPVTITVG